MRDLQHERRRVLGHGRRVQARGVDAFDPGTGWGEPVGSLVKVGEFVGG